jgi:GNAT superfamily N-acetyltransferase
MPAGSSVAWRIPRLFAQCDEYAEWVTIEMVMVMPPFYRQGFGRRLLCEQLRWQHELGKRHVLLWTEADNQPMRALARSVGLVEQGEFVEYRKAIGEG